ncbi:MAG TPA: 23S rRNA (adenine(2030)-N(6))-methyltransferase RlmJ [Hyphomicrobiaceae bacterium]|nr:23S rRNA (adenine(2030)-N(6))-methyltransferase RlmJ [Hyphomicrobiaceae bacterium]
MNYRHAYHAGNFADVLKHVVFVLAIEYLKRKEAPFRIIDTHAGRGRYLLDSVESEKTGEWRGGIGRLIGPDAEPLSADASRILAPYLDAVAACNGRRGLTVYPGSPLIARKLMRPQDRLIANELHPEDGASLRMLLRRVPAAKVMALDGWVAVRSLLPPPERRGIVLIDPPFEAEDEFARLAHGLADGLQRFASGVFIAWYPIKDPRRVRSLLDAVAGIGAKALRIELMVRQSTGQDSLNGCGLVVCNPPYALQGQLEILMPELSRRMAMERAASFRLEPVKKSETRTPISDKSQKRRMRIRT